MKNVSNKQGSEFRESLSALLGSLKKWVKKASDYTVEEGKVLSIRAKEAGHLTALNAKKHRLNREYQDLCAQIGQQVIGLSKSPNTDVMGNPRIQELMGKATHLTSQIGSAESEIERYKKDCNNQIEQLQKKAA